MVVWDCIDWTRPVFTLPSDYGAFCKSLHEMPYSSPKIQRLRKDAQESSNTVFNFRFNRVTISDKGRDLLGILQFFRSLPEALLYLNNPFWLRVIFKLLPEEPQDKQKYIKTISKLIAETKDGNTEGCEHIARRALDLAAQSFSSQDIKTYDFEALYGQAKEQQSLKQDRGGNELREELVDSVTYLRNRELLWQGFSWRCSFCEHQNWLSLERLTAISVCQICRKQESSPVAGSLHFRLNPFVEHAFASSSAQGPVLWCLNQLASHVSFSSNGPESSFAFAPALNIYTSNDSQPWSDIDISASINGLIYLVEVKRSFAGVNSKVVDQLYDLGDCIRPDVVMLAVHAEPPATGDVIELLKTLQSKLASIDVKFVLLTQKNQQPTFADHGIALPYGKEMQWAAW